MRFIPAGAGNTARFTTPAACSSVYPRWRGEHAARLGKDVRDMRFIPAGAGNTLVESITSIFSSVYPRWRGEHILPSTGQISPAGLSPLARGTRTDQKTARRTARFIPAGAGNTSRCRSCSGSGPVYPRWRGEHCLDGSCSRELCGLSPLARGTLTIAYLNTSPHRFIPAGAGNTAAASRPAGGDTVYPRWRGEHFFEICMMIDMMGLSPLARGTRRAANARSKLSRFIPAGAGNTTVDVNSSRVEPVYPRWRGEHPAVAAGAVLRHGLSPLARGTRILARCPGGSARFIPAGAGNTGFATTMPTAWPVYPRWRGEHDIVGAHRIDDRGLSPLARGTPASAGRTCEYRRFIPAGAGNTGSVRLWIGASAVYPRWRGEHKIPEGYFFTRLGLSPLARGTRYQRGDLTAVCRFIPAGAGNTYQAWKN